MITAVGLLERLYGLLVSFLALRSPGPADEGPDCGLSRLDLRIVAVFQDLNPLDRALGEGRSELLFDAVRRCFLRAILRTLPVFSGLHVEAV